MRTLFSDSMQSPRGIDSSTVDYRFPVISQGNEALPTRTRRDGYRSKPIKLTSRSIELIGSFRNTTNRSGFAVIYVWKKATTIAYKDPSYTPSVLMSSIGDRYFGELVVSPNVSTGTSFKMSLVFDEDVDFVQVYTTLDLSAISVLEGNGSGTLVHVVRPQAIEELLTIADDFELTMPSVPVLISDPFSYGPNSDPDVIP